MKKIFFIVIVSVLFWSCEILTEVLETTGDSSPALTEKEVAHGLKEALNVGIKNTVSIVSVTKGFYNNAEIKIPFPEEAIRVKEVCESVGLRNQVIKFEEKLNNAAEIASKGAVDVFQDAIRQMTIRDAMSILKGNDNAATNYFRRTSSNKLYETFYPVVKNATDEIMLAQYWTPLVNKYNTVTTITGGQQVDTDLNNYVTNKAIDGLFIMLAKEEAKIRKDPVARVSDILKKVFGSSLNPYNN
jgi:hypothetical protein